MSRSSRLQPIAAIAKSKEELASKELAACWKRIEECEAQLQSLFNFRTEYSQRLETIAHAGMNSRQFHDYNDFISRLDFAAQQQRKVLLQLKADCELKRRHWLAIRAKSKALVKVIAHYLEQEIAVEARREQAAIDDRAQAFQENRWDKP